MTSLCACAGGDPLEPLDLARSTRRPGPGGSRRAAWRSRAQAGELLRRCASASARTAAISSRAAAITRSLNACGALLGVLDRRQPRRRPASRSVRTRATSEASASSIRRRYSARVCEVVEAVGLEQQRGRVGHPAAVDRDEPVGERVQARAEAGRAAAASSSRVRADLGLEPRLALACPARAPRSAAPRAAAATIASCWAAASAAVALSIWAPSACAWSLAPAICALSSSIDGRRPTARRRSRAAPTSAASAAGLASEARTGGCSWSRSRGPCDGAYGVS